jgi:hypothetical protein
VKQARVTSQQRAQRSDIAVVAGRKELGGDSCLLPLDLGFERAPTGKTVIARHGEQCARQFRVGVRPPHLLQPFPGDFFRAWAARGVLDWT